MLAHFSPSSAAVIAMLLVCLLMVLAFETSNGFHDSSNAVATVIYTHSLKPIQAVVWSGLLNLIGVLVGGIAVAYALVEILPPDVLTPPDGSPPVPMLMSIFVRVVLERADLGLRHTEQQFALHYRIVDRCRAGERPAQVS